MTLVRHPIRWARTRGRRPSSNTIVDLGDRLGGAWSGGGTVAGARPSRRFNTEGLNHRSAGSSAAFLSDWWSAEQHARSSASSCGGSSSAESSSARSSSVSANSFTSASSACSSRSARSSASPSPDEVGELGDGVLGTGRPASVSRRAYARNVRASRTSPKIWRRR